jgi:alpha-tubulin suppressor-like RCC1 family protein
VAAGGYHSLALDSSGNVWATGLNDHGQLGLGDTDNLNTWTQVTALSGIVSIAAGEYHSIAIDSDGHVWAWGYDSTGQLGDGLTADVSTPEQVM